MVKRYLVAFVGIFFAFNANALTMKPINIEELADESNRIVQGTVLSIEEVPGKKGQLPAIVTHIRVDDSIKGELSKELAVRQFAMLGPQKKLRIPYGLPTFSVGERVIVFMPATTPTGLASPLGLGQGVFKVLGEKPDSAVVNEYGNRTLFYGKLSTNTKGVMNRLSLTATPGKLQSLTVSQLKELVRERLSHAK